MQAVQYASARHVNRLVRFADDGKASDVQFLVSDASGSRIRFTGEPDVAAHCAQACWSRGD